MKSLRKILILTVVMFLISVYFSDVLFAFSAIENFNEGTKLLEQGNFEEAIKYFERAIEQNPTMSESYYNKAYALQNLYKFDEALEQYEKAIVYNPNF